MRPATLTAVLFVVLLNAANAQKFSILPQVGFENNRTSINYNDLSTFSPLGSQLSPKVSIRADYQFMKNHGVYAAVSSSRNVVTFNFSNPESALTNFDASPASMQLRLEGGYALKSNPLYFTKSKTVNTPAPPTYEKQLVKRSCGGQTYMVYKTVAKQQTIQTVEKGWYASVQPSVGAAYIPGIKSDLSSVQMMNQANYTYRAGNWNTALVAGTNIEIGKNVQKKFVIGVQYLKALGNMDSRTITTVSNGKEMVTTLKSKTSTWNLTAGIPISLGSKKPAVKPQPIVEQRIKVIEQKKVIEKKKEEPRQEKNVDNTRADAAGQANEFPLSIVRSINK